jgi:protein SCO1/2
MSRNRFQLLCATIAVLAALVLAHTASAQQDIPDPGTGNIAGVAPAPLKDVGIDQMLGAQVPADLVFNDESGHPVRLGDYFANGKPTVLTLVYFGCPMLCTLVLNDLTAAMKVMPLEPGKDFQVITVSFNPNEKPDLATAKKAEYLRVYNRPGADKAWHFLTGNQDQIKRLADTVGFRYVWDEHSKQYIHASALIFLSPTGKVSRYMYGIEYGATDLRLSIDAAAEGKQLRATELALLYCFHYDPSTSHWGWAVVRALKVGATATILGVGALVWLLFRHERLKRSALA